MRPWVKRLLRWVGIPFVVIFAVLYFIYGGAQHEGPGEIVGKRLPQAVVAARAERVARLARPGRQILFGDLHVHTTFSADAYYISLPLMGGEGAHPPADACDYARYCSGLDFFALTDHAEALTPRRWKESVESIRKCAELAGDPADPDMVALMGFEWTQVGMTAETHYGHKNVIYRDLGPDALPPRPIGASGLTARSMKGFGGVSRFNVAMVPIREWSDRQRYLNLGRYALEGALVDYCPDGVDTMALPDDCREVAETPEALFARLDRRGLRSMVIPHGTTWGFYTPPGYEYRTYGAREPLVEVFSGHGNSERYRGWRAVTRGGDCPEPSEGFEPCCWRAGEIIRGRCDEATSKAECERRVKEARIRYVAAGVAAHMTVPGATVEDWKGCGQCTDCVTPAFNYRPGGSAQAMVARGARMGFIASSDNHSARPGTGYKEFARRRNTEAAGPVSEDWVDRLFGGRPEVTAESRALSTEELTSLPPFRAVHVERQASFFLTGGLVAVHSDGRAREALWDGLERREVYGTSGDRILLWFDLVNALGGARPMGADVTLSANPTFRVRALGALEQLEGCPDHVTGSLGAERTARLCVGECHNPSDARRRITRIEVVRIRPRTSPDEPLSELIDDPWRVLKCESQPCKVEFRDPAFLSGGRDVAYYVRAIQEPTDAVNAAGERCENGKCRPCYGDWRVESGEDCLASTEERAWSSPIYLRQRK